MFSSTNGSGSFYYLKVFCFLINAPSGHPLLMLVYLCPTEEMRQSTFRVERVFKLDVNCILQCQPQKISQNEPKILGPGNLSYFLHSVSFRGFVFRGFGFVTYDNLINRIQKTNSYNPA